MMEAAAAVAAALRPGASAGPGELRRPGTTWNELCGPGAWGQSPGQAAARYRRAEREEIMAISTVNPATGETVKTFDEMSAEDVERCLATAAATAASYRRTGFDLRARWLRRAADILDDEQDQVAAMMTTKMGKTLVAARQEVAKCASACRYHADPAAGFLADEP